MTISTRFHAARKRHGLTQAEVAAAVGVTPQRISHIERSVCVPTLQWLADAATRLGWDPAELDPRLAPSPRRKTRAGPHGTRDQ